MLIMTIIIQLTQKQVELLPNDKYYSGILDLMKLNNLEIIKLDVSADSLDALIARTWELTEETNSDAYMDFHNYLCSAANILENNQK